MSNVYIDERLLDAAGLSDFPELYAYIKGRYPKPIGELPQPVPIGDQILQQQVKNNDDIIYASNEVFEPPVPNAITKLDLSSQLERNSILASSGSDPQLIVYGDRITLTASYATTGVFPNDYLFKSYPQEARPKQGDQVIALVGTDASNTYNIFCYIDQMGHLLQALGDCRQILLLCLISHIIKIMNRQRKQIMMPIMMEKQTLWTRGMQMEMVNLKPNRMSMKQ
ncbi:MAG: hypothetical protein EZS28_041341 [Streblomastix strix]|uniref:Uncharacterized protein n=1 Tax=Streblomastix strix TaxID=222440 RepID=A0A5J4TZE3_9EUKA|nr:MAG: hypothetical protein EZS28_041341 [Streblomastix strix]